MGTPRESLAAAIGMASFPRLAVILVLPRFFRAICVVAYFVPIVKSAVAPRFPSGFALENRIDFCNFPDCFFTDFGAGPRVKCLVMICFRKIRVVRLIASMRMSCVIRNFSQAW
jgi:hypothetical protein